MPLTSLDAFIAQNRDKFTRGRAARGRCPRGDGRYLPAKRNERLVTLIAEAHQARELVLAAPEMSLASIAAAHRRCRTRLARLTALACLAPDIITAIIEGRQPLTLTPAALLAIDLPVCWKAQRQLLGFP